MTFVPFLTSPFVAAPRWSSILVTPAIAVASSSIAAATVITTTTPHGLVSGDTATITGHTGSTPAVDGGHVVTVLSPTSVSIPVTVTIAGAGGTITRTIAAPVIPLVEAKQHARIGATVTAEDTLTISATLAATQQVENDTGVRLLTQTVDVVGDRFPTGRACITLPFGPLQRIVSVQSYDSAVPAVLQTMSVDDYLADVVRIPGRIGLANTKAWPTDLRDFQPVTIRVVVGFDAIAKIPAPLLQAVREAIAWHAMHREPTLIEKDSYDWLIGPYQMPVVA